MTNIVIGFTVQVLGVLIVGVLKHMGTLPAIALIAGVGTSLVGFVLMMSSMISINAASTLRMQIAFQELEIQRLALGYAATPQKKTSNGLYLIKLGAGLMSLGLSGLAVLQITEFANWVAVTVLGTIMAVGVVFILVGAIQRHRWHATLNTEIKNSFKEIDGFREVLRQMNQPQ